MANNVEANVKVNAHADTSKLRELKASIDDIKESLERLSHGLAFDDISEETEEASESTSNYSEVIQTLANQLGISDKKAYALAKTFGMIAGEAATVGVAIGVIVSVLKIYIDRLHEAERALIKFGEGFLNVGVDGVKFFTDAIHTLVESLEEALSKMEKFAEAGAEIQTVYFNTFSVLGNKAGNEVLSFADKLGELYGLSSDELVNGMESIIDAAGSLGVSTNSAVNATENMTALASNLSMIAGSFKKASEDIGNVVGKSVIWRTSSLYVLMTNKEKNEIKSLNSELARYNYIMSLSGRIKERYISFLGTEAGQLMLLKQQYGQLMGTISKIALGLYAKVAPVLNKLIQLANIALNFIMKLFNIDLKASANIGVNSIADSITKGMNKAGASSKKAAKDIKKSTKESAKAIKELEKQVASFDDVIQIKDNKTNDLDKNDDSDKFGNLDKGIDGIDTKGLDDLTGGFDRLKDKIKDADDEFKKFKQLLKKGDYYGAGKWLADWIANKLEKINWDSIKEKAKKAGVAIAQFFNGINSNKRLFKDIGHALAEGLNTIVQFLLNFAETFDFKAFGESLAEAWKEFWATFDKQAAAKALYEWFMGIVKVIGAFFGKDTLRDLSISLTILMKNFFDNFTEEDKNEMAKTFKNILNDVFNAALVLAQGIFANSDSIIGLVNTLLDTAINWIDNGGDKKIDSIGKAIVGILDKVKNSGIIEKIKTIIKKVIDNIHLDEILSIATSIAMDIWLAKTRLKLKIMWEEIKTAVKELDIPGNLKQAGILILAVIAGIISEIIIWVKEKLDKLGSEIDIPGAFKELGSMILEHIKSIIKDIISDVKGALKFDEVLTTALDSAHSNVEKFHSEIISLIKRKMHKIGEVITNKISDIIKGIEDKLKDIVDTVTKWVQRIKDSIKDGFKGFDPFSGINFKFPSFGGGPSFKHTGFKISMPFSGKHATGGITNGASIGMIGEAGREAVLPLERNTGWMDVLAEKINNRTGESKQPIIIDLKNTTKNFYTRSEYLAGYEYITNCLKAGGVSISMEY